MKKKTIIKLAGLCLVVAGARADIAPESFMNPPDSAKPGTFYFWMNGHVSKPGITKDLEAFKKVGIRSFVTFDINWFIPHGGVTYNSDEYHDCLDHAASEADRLGLEMAMKNCSGWTCSGGPWIMPEHSMKTVVWTEARVKAGDKSVQLKQPEATREFYRDIAVLAFPTPKNNDYRLENWIGKSLNDKKSMELLKMKAVQYNMFAPQTAASPQDALISPEEVIILSDKMDSSGKLNWKPKSGDWTVLRFGYTSTGIENKPPSDGAKGLEIDKMSRAAADVHWKNLLDRVAATAKKHESFQSITIDSWEVHHQNWTDGFDKLFEERNGYDLIPKLLCLSGRVLESTETTERVLWDLRRTISDLVYENYFLYFYEKCHANGLDLMAEPYGPGPFDTSRVAKLVDWPMTEFWFNTQKINQVSKGWSWTSQVVGGAVRLSGKKVLGAESYTRSHGDWTAHPYLMKTTGDRMFCQGVNRFIFHTSVHQAFRDDVKPGVTHGRFGFQNHRNNTWFYEGEAWIKYITRCQHILQTGDHVSDLLALEGEERAFRSFAGSEGLDLDGVRGHKIDFGEIGTLDELSVDKEGFLRASYKGKLLPNRYKMLVVNKASLMSVETARKLGELAEQGVPVFAARPIRTPHFTNAKRNDAELQKLVATYWDSGKIQDPNDVKQALDKIGADCELPDQMEYVHHKLNGADYYFVSNQTFGERQERIRFRQSGKQPELWHPETGEIEPAQNWRITQDGRTEVELQLEPAESVFVVFREPTAEKGGAAPKMEYHAGAELKGPWTVAFSRPFGPKKPQVFDKLIPWNEHTKEEIKYFSGTASYRKTFNLSAIPNQAIYLDLGQVDVMARVLLNSKDLGVLWKPPFRVNLSGALKKGKNELEIRVTNLWVNKLIGESRFPESGKIHGAGAWRKYAYQKFPDWVLSEKPIPEGHRKTFAVWSHYEEGGELLPSGLTGPVRLMEMSETK
ncbi:glycosyl hydrolase [Pontiella desulfatans]|nr:glycosyl hydrolase [Pontiella desulfatans]